MDTKLFSRMFAYWGVCLFTISGFGAKAQTYCTPTTSPGGCTSGSITRFYSLFTTTGALRNIHHQPGATSAGGGPWGPGAYLWFMDDFAAWGDVLSIEAIKTSTVSYHIEGGDNALKYSIWVDFNHDGSFDSTELVAGPHTMAMGTTFDGSFTVPTTAVVGTTRMRVRSSGNGAGTGLVPSACGNTTGNYGVTSDYNFTIDACPVLSPIIGDSVVCLGSSVNWGAATPPAILGGNWTTSNPSIAYADATGNVGGLGAGTATITYTTLNYGTTCGEMHVTKDITVTGYPEAPVISGPSTLTAGATGSLFSNIPDCIWYTSNAGVVNVDYYTGAVAAGAAGTADVYCYSPMNSCGLQNYSVYNMSVSGSCPEASDLIISGSSSVCSFSPGMYTASLPGGTWSTDGNTLVNEAGQLSVTAGFTGSSTLTYTLATACGTLSTTYTVNVDDLISSLSIVAPDYICGGGSSVNLTASATGGVWSTFSDISIDTSMAGVCAVTATGSAMAGPVNVTYSISNACGTSTATYTGTIVPVPHADMISIPAVLCDNTFGTDGYYFTTPGYSGLQGTWSTDDPYMTIDPVTGFAQTGFGGITSNVTFTAAGGCGAASGSFTVNPRPNAHIVDFMRTYHPDPAPLNCEADFGYMNADHWGGDVNWSSTNPSVVTINAATGDFTFAGHGNATITMVVNSPFGCGMATDNISVDVLRLPQAGTITTPEHMCEGTTVNFMTNGDAGGYWNYSGGGAIIDHSGTIMSIPVGAAVISYTSDNSCGTNTAVAYITVDPTTDAGMINGATTIAVATTASLTESVVGGTWSSSDDAKATVDGFGVVTGVSAGDVTISYVVSGTCGSASAIYPITVSGGCTAPDAGMLSGGGSLCQGDTTIISSAVLGGTWSSSNYDVAYINSDGTLTAGHAGTAVISYTVSNACGSATSTAAVTVNSVPEATIAAPTAVCQDVPATFTAVAGNCHTTAAKFSGSSNATANTYPGVVDNMTMEAWFNWNGNTTQLQTIMANGNTSHGGYGMWLDGTTGNLSGAIGNIGWIYQTTPSSVSPNTWHHAAMVRNAGVWKLYLDGAALPTTTSAPGVTPYTPSDNFTIGSGYFSDNHYAFNGVINEAKFWTVARTPSQISADMAACDAMPQTGLAGYWKLTEGTGTTSADASGNGNNLALSSVDWFDVSGISYAWNFGDLSNGTGASATHSYIALGAYPVTLTATSGHGCSATSTQTVTATMPSVAGTISGATSVCLGASTAFTASGAAGGIWSVSNATRATVSPSGTVTGLAAGTVTVSYAVLNSCGNSIATTTITVNNSPAAISGPATVCTGATVTLTNSFVGGVWSASNTRATIDPSTGVVAGVAAGAVNITYTGCGGYRTFPITVNASPTAITGTNVLCEGTSATLSSVTTGGTWSISSGTSATINTATHVVTAVTAGTSTVSYTLATGCYATKIVTVNTAPASLSAIPNLCVGETMTLTNTVSGGTWSSSQPAKATITADGVLTTIGSFAGVAIRYTIGSCVSSSTFNVNITPAAIVGTSSICEGGATTLTNAVTGGAWSSNAESVATVSPSGIVSGISAGSTTITYAMGSCYRTKDVVVNSTPAPILLAANLCVGETLSLGSAASGGIWSSSQPTKATITPDGVMTTLAFGTGVVIRYTIGSCASSATVNVNATPASFVGSVNICEGGVTTLTNTVTGGTWSPAAPAVATISPAGVVSAVAAGSTTVTYSIGSCYRTKSIVVSTTPAPFAPLANLCVGETMSLSNAVIGGTWSSSQPSKATITADGVVTALASYSGITLRYGVGSCITSTIFNVSPTPATFVGTNSVCEGSVVTLANSVAGGTWTTASASVATVSSSGVVSGLLAGSTTVTYTLGSCYRTANVVVNVMPAPLALAANLCAGEGITLSNVPGGVWSSSQPSVATVSTSGVLSTLRSGTGVVIRYTVGSCVATAAFNVNATPSAIGGNSTVCSGSVITLTNTVTGGVWSSASSAIASVTTTTGLASGIRGMSAGTTTVTYTIGSCYRTKTLVVNNCGSKEDNEGTGITSGTGNITVRIYPNPATSTLSIEAPVKVNIQLYSVDGKMVLTQASAQELDLTRLPSGIYMLVVYDEQNKLLTRERIVKE